MFPRYLWGAEWWRYGSPVLRSSTIIGYMQSGKTTMARFLAYKMHRDVTGKGVDDSQVAYVEAPSLQVANEQLPSILDMDRVRYVMLFVDDAIKSAHSRRRNTVETMLFSDVRHWSMDRGVLVTMYATQDFRLLDRLMRNAMVYIWKTLPFEWWVSTEQNARRQILAWIGDHDVVDLLEAITKAIYSNDAEKSLAALQTAVVRIPVQNWGPRPVRGIKPLEPPSSITYVLEGEGERGNSGIYRAEDVTALAEAVIRLARVTNTLLKVNKGRYLVARIYDEGETREISLGPIAEIMGELGIEWRRLDQ